MKKFAILCIILLCNQVVSSQENDTIVEEVVMEEVEEEIEDVNVPVAVIEEVPIFPGCSGTKQERKNCLNKSIQMHVVKNFNLKKVRGLQLDPGKKKIYIKFKIDKNGEVSQVMARGPHKKAEKEGIRVVKLLPQMIPGKQRGKVVNVTYMLPITFNIK